MRRGGSLNNDSIKFRLACRLNCLAWQGMKIDRGYISPYFITDTKAMPGGSQCWLFEVVMHGDLPPDCVICYEAVDVEI